MNNSNRREFIKKTAVTGAGLSLIGGITRAHEIFIKNQSKRIGIIGLDTSHSIAFTKALNSSNPDNVFLGYKVVAAYPKGSNNIESSVSRIPKYTEEIKKYGVKIVDSIPALLSNVDVVLLETNDGRLHMEQVLPVFKAGKPVFVDKPIAASLADAIAIFKASQKYNVPTFSSSTLRYSGGMDEIRSGKIGNVIGAETYSPAKLEKTHPDLFWYGIHGVETLFTVMGRGCKEVRRISNEDTDIVIGVWNDNRIGTFRGIRKGKSSYGGTVYGEKEIRVLGGYTGYDSLLVEIIKFFETGIVPVEEEETIEILAFMEAADISRKKNGAPVCLEPVIQKAKKDASKIKI